MTDKFVGGLRVQFPNPSGVPTQRILTDETRPYKAVLLCAQCGVGHNHKTYHLDLDGDGITILSREIVERLSFMHIDFKILNVVRKPPKIRLNISGQASMFRVEEKAVAS